jgi:hypothetical protein
MQRHEKVVQYLGNARPRYARVVVAENRDAARLAQAFITEPSSTCFWLPSSRISKTRSGFSVMMPSAVSTG